MSVIETIADFSVAVSAEHIEAGSLTRSERMAEHHYAMQFEEELGTAARNSCSLAR
jgi:enolase